MTANIVKTEDGSITCIDDISGELYHNRTGAYTEALEHYVKVCDFAALLSKQPNISILDVCFGLGYNSFVLIEALLDYVENHDQYQSIFCQIIGIDQDAKILDLIPQVLVDKRFGKFCQAFELSDQAAKQLVSEWQQNGKCQLKYQGKIELLVSIEIKIADLRAVVPSLVSEKQRFDYVFHDGFSPRSMPELWTIDLFQMYTKLLSDNGRIITYSSAYAVRGALQKCGLEVRKSQSLGGKSGGTVAFKSDQPEIVNNQSILFLSDEEKDRLKGNSGIPYHDPDLRNTRKQILERRDLEIRQKSTNK
jgi:tRNA U34 5-methylaminomethyl-2-thiouridine-forming methyltransferase MnmC